MPLDVKLPRVAKHWQPGLLLVAVVAVFVEGAIRSQDAVVRVGFGFAALAASVGLGFFVWKAVTDPDIRDQLMSDADWRSHRREHVATLHAAQEHPNPVPTTGAIAELMNQKRVQMYQSCQGLFLVHTSRASAEPGQVADVLVRLHQHNDGPLSKNEVREVEYYPGPRFSAHPLVVGDSDTDFALELSAYGPLLLTAKATLKDNSTIELSRYLNFE